MPNECPRCEYMIQYKAFKAECEKAIAVKSPGPSDDDRWPLKVVLDDVGVVSSLDAQVRGKGTGPQWSVLTGILVAVYRDELAKSRAEDAWNANQEAKAARSGNPRSRAGNYEDD
jgi:hypothetical protein